MIRDINRVGKQWRKWDEGQRKLFNAVYKNIMEFGATTFLHPKTEIPTPDEFRTVAWNAAWVAADNLRGYEIKIAA